MTIPGSMAEVSPQWIEQCVGRGKLKKINLVPMPEGVGMMSSMSVIELDWEEGDFEEFEAVGDLNLLSNFGLKSQDLSMICENPDLEPDQQIFEIFKRIGAEFAWQKIRNP